MLGRQRCPLCGGCVQIYRQRILICVLLSALLSCTVQALSEGSDCDVYVSRDGSDTSGCGRTPTAPCASIQQGVLSAKEGETVCVQAGATPSPCPADGNGVHVATSLVLRSVDGMAEIDCRGQGRAFFFDGGAISAVLVGFAIRNGNSTKDGGAVRSLSSSLSVRDCVFSGNSVRFDPKDGNGGAIFSKGATVLLNGCAFVNNNAYSGGGFLASRATNLSIENSTFTNNIAHDGGGLHIEFASNIVVANSLFAGNHVSSGGGGCYFFRVSNISFTDSTFVNTVGTSGGGIWLSDAMNVYVQNTTFMNNSVNGWGGGFLAFYSTNISIGNSTFFNNTAASGGGVEIYDFEGPGFVVPKDSLVRIEGGCFRENTATFGNGGAVEIMYPPDPPQNVTFDPFNVRYREWNYRGNRNLFIEVSFENNAASSSCHTCKGGAISVTNGETSMWRCLFTNNSAGSFGGAVVVLGTSATLDVDGARFLHNQAVSGGGDLCSFAAGNLSLANTSFEVEQMTVPFFDVPNGGNTSYLPADVVCAAGSDLIDRNLLYNDVVWPWGRVYITSKAAACEPCPEGTYSLAGGTLSNGTVHAIVCHRCLGETECHGGANVSSLPDYYCHRAPSDSSALECSTCPEGYCWTDVPRPWNQSCKGHREGLLCGDCETGYSDALGSEDCVEDGKCNAAAWIFPAAFAVAALYVVLLILFPVTHHPIWKSGVYYLQTAPLLAASGNPLIRTAFAVFSLDPSVLGLSISACPWPGFSGVEKIASGFLVPVVLFLELGALFAMHCLFCRTRRSERTEETEGLVEGEKVPQSGIARYAATLAGLMLFAYEGVTSATLDLLHCVPLGGEMRLFLVGSVVCYTWYQILLFIVLGAFLVPFPLFLILLRWCIRRWWPRNAAGRAMLEVLEHPYAENSRYWESVATFRRLCLLALYALVVHPVWRSVGLFAGCFTVLLTHLARKPFKEARFGLVESAFLADLVVLSALRIPRAVCEANGLAFIGTTAEALEDLQLVLLLLPVAFCILAALWPFLSWVRVVCSGRMRRRTAYQASIRELVAHGNQEGEEDRDEDAREGTDANDKYSRATY